MTEKFEIKNSKKQLSAIISAIRVTQEEHEKIRRMSVEHQISMADVVRQMLQFSLKNMNRPETTTNKDGK